MRLLGGVCGLGERLEALERVVGRGEDVVEAGGEDEQRMQAWEDRRARVVGDPGL